MKIYESRLTWIIGYIIVISLFLYNFIFLSFGFMWVIKVFVCFVCGSFIFWTKLFKEYPKTQRKTIISMPFVKRPRKNSDLRSILKNEREEIWNNNDIWNNDCKNDIWHVKNGRIRR